jgi:hypothetical protein
MGGTNPNELKALGAPDNSQIKQLPGLHAKVYLSNSGLITSSANASNNGIGFLSAAGLVEAGTFHEPGSETYASASRWYERIWDRAHVVDEPTLARAQRAWDRRPHGGDPFAEGHPFDPTSLFDVVASNPRRFRGVGFAFTSGNSTAEQRDETVAAVVEKDKELEDPILSRQERKALSAWPVDDVFSEWSPEDVSAWPKYFVCAHWGSRGRFSYWFYERVHTAVIEGDRGMVLARRPGLLRKTLGFEYGAATMAASDTHRAALIFDRIAGDGHQLYESGERLAQLLGDLS